MNLKGLQPVRNREFFNISSTSIAALFHFLKASPASLFYFIYSSAMENSKTSLCTTSIPTPWLQKFKQKSLSLYFSWLKLEINSMAYLLKVRLIVYSMVVTLVNVFSSGPGPIGGCGGAAHRRTDSGAGRVRQNVLQTSRHVTHNRSQIRRRKRTSASDVESSFRQRPPY